MAAQTNCLQVAYPGTLYALGLHNGVLLIRKLLLLILTIALLGLVPEKASRRTEASTITVPVPDHRELRRGTLMSIIRQSQLLRELFEE